MSDKIRISQAIMHITYACTHHCPMCYANANNNNEHPTLEQLCNIVDRLIRFGVSDITLVGGDPALYPNIIELTRYIKEKNIHVSILSNTLDFPITNDLILDYVDVYEGTIHHSSKAKHDMFCCCEGAFDKLVNNLKYFSSHKKSVGLAINIIPFNYNVIYDIVSKIIKQDVALDHIILQRIIQFGRAEGSYNYELSRDMIGIVMKQIELIEKEFGLNIIFEDPFPMCSIEKKYHKYMHPCEWGITKISVDYKGNLSRCGADVFHTFGSVFDSDIFEKWNQNDALNLFRNKKYLPSKCISCENIDRCGGGCPISRNPEKGFTVDYLSYINNN